jgi:hypothetical protein
MKDETHEVEDIEQDQQDAENENDAELAFYILRILFIYRNKSRLFFVHTNDS